MTSAAIRTIIHKNVPFRIVTSDGSTIDVPHTDFISVSPDDQGWVAVHAPSSFILLDLPSITKIEIPKQQAGKP
jgi:hypothetical protein